MSNISIVTAFYDIGRGDWTPEKGLPPYLQRTNEVYIERFSYLAELENEIVVFSTPDIIEKLLPLNTKNNIKFVSYDVIQQQNVLRNAIYSVQMSADFQNMIAPPQRVNPEYWNPDYVMINLLKSHFVNLAIKNNLVTNDLVSWLDFGYCRSADKIPPNKKWNYDFDVNKIHLFNYKEYDNLDIKEIISNNIVYILGAKIVGGKNVWPQFEETMIEQTAHLMNDNMIDDDQTLMLLSTISKPELFELHKIPDHQKGFDPFVIFDNFNNGE